MLIKIWLMNGNSFVMEYTQEELLSLINQWENVLCENEGYNPIRYIEDGIHINLKAIAYIQKNP